MDKHTNLTTDYTTLNLSNPVKYLQVRHEPTKVEYLSKAESAPGLTQNRLGCEDLPWTNTLTYQQTTLR